MSTPVPEQPQARPPSPARAGLLALAILYTLYFAHDLVLPLLISGLLALLLSPLVQQMRRLWIPTPLSAGLLVALVAGGVVTGVVALAGPASKWLDRSPEILGQVESRLRPLRRPMEEVRRASEQVQRMAAPPTAGQPKQNFVQVSRSNLGELFVVSATKLVSQSVVVLFMVFFLLSSGGKMMRRVMAMPRSFAGKRRTAAALLRIRAEVTTYLGLVTLINATLGFATFLAVGALGMPNPALWGAMAWILNYMPYVGPGITLSVLALVGLLSFDEPGHGLLPAAAYLALIVIEGNVITPTLVGQRLTVPPMIVFLSLVIWTWIWGIAGALLSAPILVVLMVTADHVDALRPLAVLLRDGRKHKATGRR
jgi:predicted PurR-regulated permease PerM